MELNLLMEDCISTLEMENTDPCKPAGKPMRAISPNCFHNHNSRHALGNGGSNGHAGYVHMEDDNQYHVENHINDSGDGQKDQRTFGITYGSQNAGTEIIDHAGRHPDEINTYVQGVLA